MANSRIKIVVYSEHTLGYIFPEFPKSLHILHASVLKGAPYGNDGSSIYIPNHDNVRLASNQDLSEFRLVPGQYDNAEEYEMAV